MSLKSAAMLGMILGSTIGGWLPALWGDSLFSFSSILLGLVGGAVGIWLAWKFVGE